MLRPIAGTPRSVTVRSVAVDSPGADSDSGAKVPYSRLTGTLGSTISSSSGMSFANSYYPPRAKSFATSRSLGVSPTGAAVTSKRFSTLKGCYEYESADGCKWDDRNLEAVAGTRTPDYIRPLNTRRDAAGVPFAL